MRDSNQDELSVESPLLFLSREMHAQAKFLTAVQLSVYLAIPVVVWGLAIDWIATIVFVSDDGYRTRFFISFYLDLIYKSELWDKDLIKIETGSLIPVVNSVCTGIVGEGGMVVADLGSVERDAIRDEKIHMYLEKPMQQ